MDRDTYDDRRLLNQALYNEIKGNKEDSLYYNGLIN